jgi:hypothetical protein
MMSRNVQNRFKSLATKPSARTSASCLSHNRLNAGESGCKVGKPGTNLRHCSTASIVLFGAIATMVLMMARTSTAAGSTAITLRSIATGSTSLGGMIT